MNLVLGGYVEFKDRNFWRKLASKYSVKLPRKGAEVPRAVYSFCARLGVKKPHLRRVLGCDLGEFREMNPKWPAYAIAGLVLEDKYYHE